MKHLVLETEGTHSETKGAVEEESHLGSIAEPGPMMNSPGAEGLPTGLKV